MLIDWSKADQVLRARFATERTWVLADELGFTEKQLSKRAYRLGLSKTKEHVSQVCRESLAAHPVPMRRPERPPVVNPLLSVPWLLPRVPEGTLYASHICRDDIAVCAAQPRG